ncbi:MAG: HAMP domain-containing protein [Proteobacteria bacterium]|jgi:two-component system osmolarity sensor histidine kinase EnvZ|nr:HAMP domain-containing protein [Pseudomonadota bacterium]
MSLFQRIRRSESLQPQSLLGRTTLTLAFSSFLIAVVSTIALNVFVIDPIAERSADDEAALLVLSAQTWVELPPQARPYFELELAQSHDLIISVAEQTLPPLDRYLPFTELLLEKLQRRLALDVRMYDGNDLVWVDVPMAGYNLQIGFSPDRRDVQLLYVAIVIASLGAGIVFLTSLLIVRKIARPLVQVGKQAETFRGLAEIEPLPETGPRELVSLARNFNTMADEIALVLANRTTLMAGISHDLRTPLTRMRLALALLPDTVDQRLVQRFEGNLEAMDVLIGDALRFAQGTREEVQSLALAPYVREVLDTFDQEIDFSCSISDGVILDLAPNAFSRVLSNLVGNAIKYANRVQVSLDGTEVVVSDDGPGIPESERGRVFQPFYRLEASRNVSTGGSGLGLAVVQQLSAAHGWKIHIADSALGGAEFRWRFDINAR